MLESADFIKIGASAALFICVYFVFGRLLATRFIALVSEREARTTGDEHQATLNRRKAQHTRVEIEEQLRQARFEGVRRRDERLNRAREAAQGILVDAERKSVDSLTRARLEIARLKAEALRDVEAEAERFADLMASKAIEPSSKPMIH